MAHKGCGDTCVSVVTRSPYPMSSIFRVMPDHMSVHDRSRTAVQPVTLSADDVAHAARLLELLIPAEAKVRSSDIAPSERLLAVARLVQLVRHTRAKHFSPAMFGEPAWDLLVAIYTQEESGGSEHTVSTAAKQAGVPVSTALRWIEYLEEKKLITREANSADRRTTAVKLSSKGRTSLNSYFGDVIESLSAAPIS